MYKENQEGNLEEVTNVDGQVVEAINPNEEGYYEFSHLPAENYVVKIEYNGEEYKLVEKEVGSNVEINSKFEIETNTSTEGNEGEADSNSNTEIGKTELITKLNDNSNFMIIEENVNAGLLKKINLEFTKLENENTDNSDIIINGNIKVQITAIGNPPGFIQNQENGELLLPNRAYFEFPTSGSIGSKTIYQIGIAIITAGMIILLTRKFVIIKNNKI